MITASGKPANASPGSASPVIFLPESRAGGSGRDGRFPALRYGYDAGAKEQSASAVNGIVLLFSIIPGIGYLITAGVVRMLKVNREFMCQIRRTGKRRANYEELNTGRISKPVNT